MENATFNLILSYQRHMELHQIRSTDDSYWKDIEKCYLESFPEEERRAVLSIKNMIHEDHDSYRLFAIVESNTFIGMISYWDFKDFYYIEHFAIDKSNRGKGIGSRCINFLKESLLHTIILEVEPPLNKDSERRINFYIRNGFSLREEKYMQPAYQKNLPSVELRLMVFLQEENPEISTMVYTIYKNVYNIN